MDAAPDTIPVGILSEYLRENLPSAGRVLRAERVGRGRSNLTYLLVTEREEMTLRRPPLGRILPTAHDMLREYRFLSALANTDIPVPRPLLYCADSNILGTPFYITQFCRGIVAREWPETWGKQADRGRTSAALILTLVRLHAVNWRAIGLDELARPEGYVDRQLRRLAAQWEASKTREVPAVALLQERLARCIPPLPEPTIVHGDFGLHNVILSEHDPGEIVAVLDWELATIGDPLADLGWMLALWGQGNTPPGHVQSFGGGSPVTCLPGFWTRMRLIEEYARLTGRDVGLIEYYFVLALYKLVVIWQGAYARYLAAVTQGEGFEDYGKFVSSGAEMAMAVAESSSIPQLRGID